MTSLKEFIGAICGRQTKKKGKTREKRETELSESGGGGGPESRGIGKSKRGNFLKGDPVPTTCFREGIRGKKE